MNFSLRKLSVALLIGMILTVANAEIYRTADQVTPLLPGAEVPAFTALNLEGAPVNVNMKEIERPLVLTFYRGGWCPYCNLHLAELRTAEEELKALGFDVWFISPDKPELLKEGEDTGFNYTLLSDPDMSVAEAFGIAFDVDDATLERYLGFGLDLKDRSGSERAVLPAPATFLIGSDGVVQFSYVNPDFKVRLAPEVLVAAAQAYTNDAQKRLLRN